LPPSLARSERLLQTEGYMPTRVSHVIAFDDAPFERLHRGDVLVVGVVYAGQRMEGVVSTKVRRDGANATARIAQTVARSRFAGHLQVVLLQGIAFAGFNVVDIQALHSALALPVVVVARKSPDLNAIKRALQTRVPGGARKWRLIERAGPMEAANGVFVQRVGISLRSASRLLERLAVHGKLPEPLRVAHMIGAGVTSGESRHRA
jgi:endonuclease V-like protein UPF0215 family